MANYRIEVEFGSNWSVPDRPLLLAAANRWMQIVSTSLPPVDIGGGRIVAGLVISANIVPGPAGGTLALSGPTKYRPQSARYLPAAATLQFEQPDFVQLKTDGRIGDVLFHEVAHGMGFGMLWPYLGLIHGAGTADPRFTGARASLEYGALRGSGPTPVPVQNSGGQGVADLHWREAAFGTELMSPYLPTRPNPLSRLTLASMIDLGYAIDLDRAEPYALPADSHWFDKKLEDLLPRYRVVPPAAEILPETALVEIALPGEESD